MGNPDALRDLDEAIANLTRLLGKTDDPKVAGDLVAERAAMREELRARREAEARASGKVRSIDEAKGRR